MAGADSGGGRFSGRAVDPDGVTRFVHGRLAGYKVPRTVVVATVPRGPNGKVLFNEARTMFEDTLGDTAAAG